MKKIIWIGLASLMLFISCKKDFLDITPTGELSKGILATRSGVNLLLIGAYAQLAGQDVEAGPSNWVFGGIASDDAKASSYGDLPEIERFAGYKVISTNSVLSSKWNVCYSGIQRANDVLRVLPLLPTNEMSENDVLQVKAEAIFLRAVFHFELIKIFRYIPYIDESISYENGNFCVPNTSLIWDKIEADFKFAANNITSTKTDAGRGNSWAAKAFLAKVYMFHGKFAEAKPLLEDIINNGVTASGQKYALVNFFDNFDIKKKNGPESVFAVQYSVNDGSRGENGNYDLMMNTVGVPGLEGGEMYDPSFSLANCYKTDAVTGLPLIDTYNDFDITNDQGLKASDPFTPYQGTLDPRLDLSIARRDIPVLDWGLFGVYWTYHQNIDGPYQTKKYTFSKADKEKYTESVGWTLVSCINYPMIRFADVLLWAAEAEVEVGSLAQAERYVNVVRARAADPAGWVKTYVDNNEPSKGFTDTPAANYNIGLYTGQFVSKGQEFARKAVRFERRIELALEGHRFFDLQRWDNGTGYMANTINTYLDHERAVPGVDFPTIQGVVFKKGINEIYPIPQSQIDLSFKDGSSVLVQNPGY